MLADYHIHSDFSDDSTYPMEEVIKRGIEIGLSEMCFTEHVDYGVPTAGKCNCDDYEKEILRCKEIYGDKIILKMGIEFGMQTHTVKLFQETFNKHDFDFVLLSCHQVGDEEFWTQEFQKNRTQKEYNEKYYEEILKIMDLYDDYSVLAHLDVIKRYDEQGDYSFELVKDIITKILKKAILQGKGIEINTSSFRYEIGDLTPSRDILKLYKELDGEIITIGSDSHKEEHLGFKLEYVKNELKKLGFKNLYTFEKMKPIKYSL